MADPGIKVVTIYKEELPPVDANNLSYNIRYRVISEDRNRSSEWSNIYQVGVSPIGSGPFSIDITTPTTGNKTANVVWSSPDPNLLQFDIYVKYIGSSASNLYSWVSLGRVASNNYGVLTPTTISDPANPGGTESVLKIQVAVQKPTSPSIKENYPTNNVVTIFESAEISI